MGNVVSLFGKGVGERASGDRVLLEIFAKNRKDQLDVLWLKENAELLGVIKSRSSNKNGVELAPLADFYSESLRRLSFFRQYYRFILSICLDMEDLGFEGDQGEQMAHWVARQDVACCELSDLQRAEARCLLARRNVLLPGTEGLDERLWGFASNSGFFAVPNKRASYELTHIIFYLTDYGRRSLALTEDVRKSLHYVGLSAYLDQDEDLLSEVAICLKFCDEPVPSVWHDYVCRKAEGFRFVPVSAPARGDAYHPYLMCKWYLNLVGREMKSGANCAGHYFIEGERNGSALQGVSMVLYAVSECDYLSWGRAKELIYQDISPFDAEILTAAEASSEHFESFFESFARMDRIAAQ